MKNILLLLIAVTAFSCSEDDSAIVTNPEPTPAGDVVLLRKKISTNNQNVYTSIFNYDGNKLMSIVNSDGYKYNYTYQNGKLAMQQIVDAEGVIETTSTYTYTGDKLSEYRSVTSFEDTNFGNKVIYTYNEDSTISTKYYDLTNNGNTETLKHNGLYTLTNGNITSYIRTLVGTGRTYVLNFTYDNKNNPDKNKFSNMVETLTWGSGGNNNILSISDITGSPITDHTTTYTYTYNSDNYPITQTNAAGNVTQFFYE